MEKRTNNTLKNQVKLGTRKKKNGLVWKGNQNGCSIAIYRQSALIRVGGKFG